MDENETSTATFFSNAVDEMLNEKRSLHSANLSKEMDDLLFLSYSLSINHYVPRPAFQQAMERSLTHQFRRSSKGVGFIGKLRKIFFVPRLQWKPILLGGLLILIIITTSLMFNEKVRAEVMVQVQKALQWTGIVIVEKDVLSDKVTITRFPEPISLDEAQSHVSFRILQPAYVPEMLNFNGAIVFQPENDPLAFGPRIYLSYGEENNGFAISEYKAQQHILEGVAEGTSQEVIVNGQPAIYIFGRWEVAEDGTFTSEWLNDMDRLIYEVDEVAIWIHAHPPLGSEELIKIAKSLE